MVPLSSPVHASERQHRLHAESLRVWRNYIEHQPRVQVIRGNSIETIEVDLSAQDT